MEDFLTELQRLTLIHEEARSADGQAAKGDVYRVSKGASGANAQGDDQPGKAKNADASEGEENTKKQPSEEKAKEQPGNEGQQNNGTE